jgi:hypothetical protein
MIVPMFASKLFGEDVYITTKSAPTMLTLRRTGYQGLKSLKTLSTVIELGFPLLGLKDGLWERISTTGPAVEGEEENSYQRRKTMIDRISKASTASASATDYTNERSHGRTLEELSMASNRQIADQIDPELVQAVFGEYTKLKIAETNIFQVIRTCWIAERTGNKPPNVLEYDGDLIRLSDVIPRVFLTKEYTGKTGCKFTRLVRVEDKVHVIFHRTHFGNKITEMCLENGPTAPFAKLLRARITAFLSGRDDPMIRGEFRQSLQTRETNPNTQARAERFLQCLMTVDGIFAQRLLAFPEEDWTWERFDLFNLGNLSMLITDEFLDGTVKEETLTQVTTNYAALKKVRKAIKLEGHLGDTTARETEKVVESFPWLHQFLLLRGKLMEKTEDEYIACLSVLSQTRGAGSPPPVSVLKSKYDFLKTISGEPVSITKTMKLLVQSAIDELISSMPDESLTGLSTAARLRVTTSACYERSVAEDGTAQAINDICFEAQLGREVMIRDLWTGKPIGFQKLESLTVGEYIFWRSLEEVLAMNPARLAEVRLLMVREPGKARTVTKGHACLKVVLDVVNKLVAKPFAKAFPSSASGMEKSNHGWNVFKELFHRDLGQMTFEIAEQTIERESEGVNVELTTFTELFAGSTDFDTATDYMQHFVGGSLANGIMRKTGIPLLLIGIVNKTCFSERTVEFAGTGVFESIGLTDSEMDRRVILRTGVLMGDPLTKVCLHLVNLGVRAISEKIVHGRLSRVQNGAELLGSACSRLEA